MNSNLAEWLKANDLERFRSIFEENEVDFSTLRLLKDDDLKEIGLPFGPRKRILSLLREENAPNISAPSPHFVGAPLGERRQLTVLFCDMVGFTALSQKLDPETLQVVIRAYEEACSSCIVRFEGYVFTCLGDGVVAFFGFPLAHEGEAGRAIRAGLDIIEAMTSLELPIPERLQVRIGIATGIVVVSTGERNAVGDTMNLASRLQTIAKPGSLIVSDRTRRLAGDEFVYEDFGAKDLKGVGGQPRVFRVVGVGAAESRFEAATQRGMTLMVGRNEEIAALLDAWRSVRETGTGRVVVLQGEAGIGKSRIVNSLRERFQNQSLKTLVLQCSPFYVNSAFFPVRAWLERSVGLVRDADPKSRLDKLEAYVVGRLGMPKDDMRFISALLGIPYQDRYGAIPLPPKLAKEETMRALIDLARAEARAGPIFLLVEDAHWADPTTLDFLRRLSERFAEISALLVITARHEFRSPWRGRPQVATMDLAKLTAEESRIIVSRLVGGKALPPGLEAQIVARADGVPLFIEELTKSILESGDLVLEGDHYAYSGSSADITLPETLRDSLMARLDRVPATKEIAQVGAVIGREFSYELIAGLELTNEDTLENGLRLLTASGLATCHGEIPNAVFAFSHALVQDAAYDSLLKSRRRQLHADIARLLEERWPETRESAPELLAYHYNAAGQHGAAAPLWLHAGTVAVQRFALPEAISHLRTGTTALMNTPPSKARDLLELSFRTTLGPALLAHRGWAHRDVGSTLEPAWRLAQSLNHHSSYLPILNALAVHHMCIDQLEESLHWADRLLKAGEELGDDGLQIMGYRNASAVHYWKGDFVAARRAGDQVHKLYNHEKHHSLALLTNNDPFTGEGIYRSQYLWMMGYPDQALAANRATEANARRGGHPFDLAFALTLGAQIFDLLSDPDALLRRTEEAERVGRERDIPLLGEIMVEISRGIAWLRSGRAADGSAQLDRGVTRLNTTGHQIWIWYLRALQAEGLAQTGDLQGAATLMAESVKRFEGGEERSHYAEALRLRGWLLDLLGEGEAAEASLRKSIEVAQAQQAKSWELRSATTLARLQANRGRRDEALALLAPVFDWFTEGRDTKDLMTAAQVLDELRGTQNSPVRAKRSGAA
jgi:class 3 adenylate cyclase/tetratricopeptide (TPR) repeat protein